MTSKTHSTVFRTTDGADFRRRPSRSAASPPAAEDVPLFRPARREVPLFVRLTPAENVKVDELARRFDLSRPATIRHIIARAHRSLIQKEIQHEEARRATAREIQETLIAISESERTGQEELFHQLRAKARGQIRSADLTARQKVSLLHQVEYGDKLPEDEVRKADGRSRRRSKKR